MADKERIMELACDLCRWPGEYKDPDALWEQKCDTCPLLAYLEEEEEESTFPSMKEAASERALRSG